MPVLTLLTSLLIVAVAVAVAVPAVLGLGAGTAFHELTRSRARIQDAWSRVDVQLTRRHQLIPDLIETVRSYAAHEYATFEAVTSARNGAIDARAGADPRRICIAENHVTQALHALLAVAEKQPRLGAVPSFRQLREQLTEVQEELERALHHHAASARDYDTAIRTFPRNLLAYLFGFAPSALWEADPAATDSRQPGLTSPGLPH